MAQTDSNHVFVTDAQKGAWGGQGLSPSLLGLDMHQFYPPEAQLEHHNFQEGGGPSRASQPGSRGGVGTKRHGHDPPVLRGTDGQRHDHVDVSQAQDEEPAAGEVLPSVDPRLASARLDDHSAMRIFLSCVAIILLHGPRLATHVSHEKSSTVPQQPHSLACLMSRDARRNRNVVPMAKRALLTWWMVPSAFGSRPRGLSRTPLIPDC